MLIAGLAKNSCVDYPGKLACVVFCPGCNMDCFYCHNRDIIGPPEQAPQRLSTAEVMAFLEKRKNQLEAVVVSGGEPTLQKDLFPFLEQVKSMGYLVKLDSNGRSPQQIQEIYVRGLVDYFAIDYKAPLARYTEICGPGADGAAALKTIRLLKMARAPFEVRTTVIPQLAEADLLQMANELPPLPRYVLNPYRVPPHYKEADRELILAKPYTKEEIDAMAEKMREWQPNMVATQ